MPHTSTLYLACYEWCLARKMGFRNEQAKDTNEKQNQEWNVKYTNANHLEWTWGRVQIII